MLQSLYINQSGRHGPQLVRRLQNERMIDDYTIPATARQIRRKVTVSRGE